MDDLICARWQMAITLAFHIVFAAFGIGLPVLMAIAEYRYVRHGLTLGRELAKKWAKVFAVFFAIGAVSGTVLSFELGLLWPVFMAKTGAIIGLPFAMEGFAFFAEAIFLGIYIYGWERISPKMHLVAGIIIALAGAASAAFVMMANAWMNTPAGFTFDVANREFINIEPFKVLFTAAWSSQTLHMLLAAYQATALAVAGLHAYLLLREPQNSMHQLALKIAMLMIIPVTIGQLYMGDWAARVVAKTQPIKLAALEGQFDTQTHAPLRIGGIPDPDTETHPYAIEIPGLLSFLAYHDFAAKVMGLKEVAPAERPPVIMTHLAFQIMVAVGFLVFAVIMLFVFLWIRGRAMPQQRWILCLLILIAPLGFVALECGWIVTELGRQPWIVVNYMRVSEAVTPMPNIWAPLFGIVGIYLFLTVVLVGFLRKELRNFSAWS